MDLLKTVNFILIITLLFQIPGVNATEYKVSNCKIVFASIIKEISDQEKKGAFLINLSFKELESFALSKLKEIEKTNGLKLEKKDWMEIRRRLFELTTGTDEQKLERLEGAKLLSAHIKYSIDKEEELTKKSEKAVCRLMLISSLAFGGAGLIANHFKHKYSGTKSTTAKIFDIILNDINPDPPLSAKEVKLIEDKKQAILKTVYKDERNAKDFKTVEKVFYVTALAFTIPILGANCFGKKQ